VYRRGGVRAGCLRAGPVHRRLEAAGTGIARRLRAGTNGRGRPAGRHRAHRGSTLPDPPASSPAGRVTPISGCPRPRTGTLCASFWASRNGWRPFPSTGWSRECTPERVAQCRFHIAEWLRTQDKHEGGGAAQKLGLTLVALNNARDLMASPQYEFRRFFAEVRHPVCRIGASSHGSLQAQCHAGEAADAGTAAGTTYASPAGTPWAARRPGGRSRNPGVPGDGTRTRWPAAGCAGGRTDEGLAGPYAGKLLPFSARKSSGSKAKGRWM